MQYSTGEWAVTSESTLTIKSSAWRRLAESFRPDKQMLLLTWGSAGVDTQPRWLVSACNKNEIPLRAFKGYIARIGALTVIIPQKKHVADLRGRTMRHDGESLVID